MKNILYLIYAFMFYFYSLISLNKNKTTFIMTHDESINGNIMCMYRKIKEEQPNHICKFITKSQFKKDTNLSKFLDAIKFIVVTPYYLATSNTIFLDNVFLPMAYIKFKSQVKVVQLWHGCNTLKKFGQLSNTGSLKELEKRANSTYTHVIVSSKKMINLHKEVFGVDERVIYPLGLPRLDVFFSNDKIQKQKEIFYSQYVWLKDKKIILYAPTFRDNKINEFDNNMNLDEVVNNLPEEYIIVNKFHPFVAEKYGKIESDRIIDMSDYQDLTRLLLVANILISDYSSIVFEYALLNRPIIFYAYDKEEYEEKIRGFYYEYNNYVKKIARDKKQLLEAIIEIDDKNLFRVENVDWIEYEDSNSSERIYNLVYVN